MKKNMISIIIPVYNKENTLGRCLDSIINQTYKNLEIIIIDDGSTDKSSEISSLYMKENKNIKYYYQKNKGVSVARNKGIKIADGEFIQFVDADDFLELNMCEILHKKILDKNSDIVICGRKDINEEEIIYHKCINRDISNIYEIKEDFSYLYKEFFFHSPCNKIYRKEKIKFYFKEDKSLGEDLIFNIDNIKFMNNISFVENCLYNYVYQKKSLSKERNDDFFFIQENLYEKSNEFCSFFNIKDEYKSAVDEIFFETSQYVIVQAVLKRDKEQVKKIVENKNIQKAVENFDDTSIKRKILRFLIKRKMNNIIYYYYKVITNIFSK